MKSLKRIFIFIISLFLITFFYVINSSFVIERLFEYISKQIPIKYTSLQGSLYSGISIENLNYEDNLKVEKFYIKPELLSLLVLDIYIKELKIDGITLDNKLLKTTQNQNKKNNLTTLNLPFKLIIKNLEASIYNYSYEDYRVEKLSLKSKNLTSDLSSYISGDFKIETKSNIANVELNGSLNRNKYNFKSILDLNKDFFDKNIIESSFLDKFIVEANGDLKKIDFQIDTKNFAIKANKPIEFKEIKTLGTYDFSSFDLDLYNINAFLNYDFINTNINGSLKIKNNDINSLTFNSNLQTFIKKDILKTLQNNIQINSKISGNINELDFSNELQTNSLKIENENIKIESLDLNGNAKFNNDEINILSDLNLNSNIIKQKSKIEIKLNSSKIENFLIKAKTTISEFSYKDLKSNSFGIINIDTIYKKNLLDLKLKSKLLNGSIYTKDLNKYFFDLDLKEINPNEFYKFDESIKISTLKGKINGEFEKNLSLKSDLILNNSFDINANLSTNKDSIQGQIYSKSFNTNFLTKEKNIILNTQIKELNEFEKELHKILDFPNLNLVGLVNLQTQIEDSNLYFELLSPKISLEKESIEKIDIKASLKNKSLYFEKLNFFISTIYDVNLEKNFILKNQASLNLDNFNGNFEFDNISIFTSTEDNNLNLKINTKDLAINYEIYGKTQLNSNILVSINQENKVVISGEIRANKLNINYEIPSMSISKDKDIVIVYKNKNKKEKDAFFEDFALELTIFADDLKYKVKNIDLKASAILFLKKDFHENIKLFGSIQDVLGTFSELGKTYTIKDSNIYFRGLEPIDPILDIHANYSLNDVDISIIISGTLNEPRINLSSTPVMSQKDILSYLIFGTKFSSDSQTNTQSKQSQASLFLLNELSKDYAKELGIDILYFQYDPTTQYIETYVGKNISQKSKVMLKNKSTGGELIFIRELTKLWNIELGFEEDTQSLDLIYKKRY